MLEFFFFLKNVRVQVKNVETCVDFFEILDILVVKFFFVFKRNLVTEYQFLIRNQAPAGGEDCFGGICT